MDKFKDRFLQSVDSHAIVLRLEAEKVISGKLSHSIKNQYVGDGNQELFLYLQRHADPESIRNLCDVMNIDGYPRMSKLGQDMKKYLYQLTSMYVLVIMYMYFCLYVRETFHGMLVHKCMQVHVQWLSHWKHGSMCMHVYVVMHVSLSQLHKLLCFVLLLLLFRSKPHSSPRGHTG